MKVRTVLIWEGAANALLVLVKVVVGLQTHSAAILSDALHSLTDLANNFIAWFVIKVAEEPPDHDHPYGHQKFEQLAVFTLAGLLTVVAVQLIIESIKRFGAVPEQSKIGLVLMGIALVCNIVVAIWENYWAKRLNSEILRADARHTFSDIATSTAVIVGWQLSLLGWPWLDPLFALLVAGFVLYLAYDLFRRAVPILVDSAGYDSRKLAETVRRVSGVRAVRRVRSRQHGGMVVADIVVAVDRNLTTAESHKIADAIERLLATRFNIHDTTVHIEPDR